MRRMDADAVTMDKIVALCKRRGLIFPASEIYGGIANTYDYGHYGVLLKRNVIDAWWQAMTAAGASLHMNSMASWSPSQSEPLMVS